MQERHSRQSFLGDQFLERLETDWISTVGLGGGGSIYINELAHIGFKKYFACDPDDFEESNINRLLGSRFSDGQANTPKIEITERTIKGILPDATVRVFKEKWQTCISREEFKNSKLILSALDDLSNRIQVEAFARRQGIPLIDIGLSIEEDSNGHFHSMGQVVLSHPKGPCFKCYGFITDADLKIEADKYGAAGIRPQVIWANGTLASIAVGLGVELLSGWTGKHPTAFYKHFDGNKLSLVDNLKIEKGLYGPSFKCPHY